MTLLGVLNSYSQNDAKKWYFGYGAGLDFNTNPPTILTNGTMSVTAGCASIADASGNLLFYTNGSTVWDRTHAVMANGTGLASTLNNSGYPQTSIILKRPGSATLYYVFSTWPGNAGNAGIYYSIVDISLASGNGSVTTKSNKIYNTSSGKVSATKHCNGNDIWVVFQDYNWNGNQWLPPSFQSFLLASTGVNTLAVISTPTTNLVNNNNNGYWGCMKISPNGKKLGTTTGNNNNNNNTGFELYDFDNTTGIVSNLLYLPLNNNNNFNNNWGYGVEFSPDGTKFYGSRYNNFNNQNVNWPVIAQWDLCAGSPTAIVASMVPIFTVTNNNSNNNYYGTLQLAPNGKIYVARYLNVNNNNNTSLGVINNPNASGLACNYVDQGQSIAPKLSYYGLPNFMGSYFIQPPPATPFTHTVSNLFGCQTASFNSIYTPSTVALGCASQGYTLTNILWNFGDPSSGINNTSNLSNPSHAYTTLGTYTAQLILYYSCGGGTDTIRQVINVNQPCISVNSTSITCANLGSATVAATGGIGPFSYTWMPSGQTNSVATGLSPGTYTLSVFDFGNNFTYTATTTFNSLIPLLGNLSNSSSLACNGVATGTANYTNITGGSGSQNFLWTNGLVSYTAATPNTLSAGLWSVTVSDGLTGCAINDVFFINQPSATTLNLSSSTGTSCVGTEIILTGTTSGGTPGYTYSWTAGPTADTYSVLGTSAGAQVHTLSSQDANNCLVTQTISITFVANPSLVVSNTSICPLESGTLTVTGATNYTWSTAITGSVIVESPTLTTSYTVVGEAFSCTSSAVSSIILKPLPVPQFVSNSPICNAQTLLFSVSTGTSFVWTGVNAFASSTKSNTINNANPGHSGSYQVTVTAANSCTAATSGSVTVNPTPTVSATGATVCNTQIVNLTANSFAGSSYFWTGPNGFLSSQQNPTIVNPVVAASGNYNVRATSAVGCTNSAVTQVTVTQTPIINTHGSNTQKCFGDNLQLYGNSNHPNVSYNWSGPNGFFSNQQNPVITAVSLPASGIYVLTVTEGPCIVNVSSQPVIIHDLPTATITSNSPVCETKRLTFSATSTHTIVNYLWQIPNGFPMSGQIPNRYRDTSTLAYSGDYSLTLTDNHGCISTTTATLTVLPNPTLTAMGDTVCFKNKATLKAEGGNTYVWYNNTGIFSYKDEAQISSANFTTATVYTVVGQAPNSCTAIATATVMTRPLPLPSIKLEPKPAVCLNTSVTLNGYGAKYYLWEGPSNLSLSGSRTGFMASNVSYTGEYTLTAIDAYACQSQTTTSLKIYNLPNGGLRSDRQLGCVPFDVNLNFIPSMSTIAPIKSQTWYYNKKKISDTDNFIINIKTVGEQRIEGTLIDTNGCVNTVTASLNGYGSPKANFTYSPEKPVESFDAVLFTNTSKGDDQTQWKWYLTGQEEKELSDQEHADYLFDKSGKYSVVLVVNNKWGCGDTTMKHIQIEPDFNVFVPTAFTPNTDGTNEVFIPVTSGVKFYEFEIYDRWGKKIFTTKDATQGWDGTYQGEPCKNEVYVWRMLVSAINGTEKELKGVVTLFR